MHVGLNEIGDNLQSVSVFKRERERERENCEDARNMIKLKAKNEAEGYSL